VIATKSVHGISNVLGSGGGLKGCAARTG